MKIELEWNKDSEVYPQVHSSSLTFDLEANICRDEELNQSQSNRRVLRNNNFLIKSNSKLSDNWRYLIEVLQIK